MRAVRRGLVAGLLMLFVACTPEAPPAKPQNLLPVVVYAAYPDASYLPALLEEFSRDTGQLVIVRNGTVPGIIDDVLQGRVQPPADLLLTPSVAGAWRAAEEGQLRPNYSAFIAAQVPGWLRDPDNFWVALSYRNAAIAFDSRQFDDSDFTAYEDLAAPKFRHKLCLSSSALSINRSVLAMLLRKLGKRDAELAVRSWVANLALPPFDTEQELLHALASGSCAVAIISGRPAEAGVGLAVGIVTPQEAYAAAEAIGITRHARNPDGAAQLVDWLLQPQIQERHAAALAALPAVGDAMSDNSLIFVASGDAEARLLAERARYR